MRIQTLAVSGISGAVFGFVDEGFGFSGLVKISPAKVGFILISETIEGRTRGAFFSG